jgi:hypothetical protein
MCKLTTLSLIKRPPNLRLKWRFGNSSVRSSASKTSARGGKPTSADALPSSMSGLNLQNGSSGGSAEDNVVVFLVRVARPLASTENS